MQSARTEDGADMTNHGGYLTMGGGGGGGSNRQREIIATCPVQHRIFPVFSSDSKETNKRLL